MLTPRHTLLFIFSSSLIRFNIDLKTRLADAHVVDQFLVPGCAVLGHTVANALHLFLPQSARTQQKSKTRGVTDYYAPPLIGGALSDAFA